MLALSKDCKTRVVQPVEGYGGESDGITRVLEKLEDHELES